MRASYLATVLGLALLVIPQRLPAQTAHEEDLARWKSALQSQEERLRRQEWKAVAKDSRDLIEEMVDRLLVGEASATMLALAVVQQAVAESALGNREDALWLLHLAQNLDARFRDATLSSYGPAGEELERFRLRQPGEAPAAWPQLPAEGSFQQPRILRRKEPRTPGALARARVAADIEVEMAVGPDGRVLEPVLLTKPEYPSLAFVVLESLRGWRFEPAHASGAAVPALFRARISHEGLQKAAEAVSSHRFATESQRNTQKRLESFDARLRRGEGQAVHAEVQEIVAGLRASGEDGLLAMGLRALALAEAGMGRRDEAVWHWQVAQNLEPGFVLDPAPYGEAGALLAWHKLRRRDEAPAGLKAVALADLGTGATPPRKIAGDDPELPKVLSSPGAPRWARLQAVIDTQGRVVEPVVLAGRSEPFQWAALEAVRTWRFEPARYEGEPVAVLLDIDLPPRAGTPLAEILPLSGEAGSIHALLLQNEWEKARARAAILVQSEAERGAVDPRRSAAALALLALAEAGLESPSSSCYWHAAQGLYGDLYHADLAAYGIAGALLEESNPWMLDEEIFRVGSSAGGEKVVVRPEKIRGGTVPQYTTRDRKAGVRGYILMETVIDRYGRITQPRLLKGLTPGIDLKALAAICDWRFKPATAGERPVNVDYTLTINFDVSF